MRFKKNIFWMRFKKTLFLDARERSSMNHLFSLAKPDLALLSMLFLYSCFL